MKFWYTPYTFLHKIFNKEFRGVINQSLETKIAWVTQAELETCFYVNFLVSNLEKGSNQMGNQMCLNSKKGSFEIWIQPLNPLLFDFWYFSYLHLVTTSHLLKRSDHLSRARQLVVRQAFSEDFLARWSLTFSYIEARKSQQSPSKVSKSTQLSTWADNSRPFNILLLQP